MTRAAIVRRVKALYERHDATEVLLIHHERRLPARRLTRARRTDPVLVRLWDRHDRLERTIIGLESRLAPRTLARLKGWT